MLSLLWLLPLAVANSTCDPVAGAALVLDTCDAAHSAEAQQWVLPTDGSAQLHLKVTYVEGLCMDAGEGQEKTIVTLQQCAPQGSATASKQEFQLAPSNNGSSTRRLVHVASKLCVNLNRHKQIDLWKCTSDDGTSKDDGDEEWTVSSLGELQAKNACLSACKSGGPSPTPSPEPPSAGPVVLNGSATHLRFEGVWAMSANGAARELFEYPEPTRSQILDLLFTPGLGTRWQGLKVEIGGDVESSYGSMSSYAHVANQSLVSFERGVQWWLIKEAQKRDPTIPLMALSWGMPAWVGNGTTLSQGGVDYHVNYILGAKRHHNISVNWVGIWNEAPWSREYVLLLRKGLDAAGLQHVRITAADGGVDVIDAAAKDSALAEAIGSFGVHAHVLPPDPNAAKLGIPYFNTENDLVDGAPGRTSGWGGTMVPGLNWPLSMLLNYIVANGTATMLCPAFHGWSLNLGRHNHGPVWFNDPWSGFYQLGAPFFTQAQVTQFTEIGWLFLQGASGRRGCGEGTVRATGQPPCALTYAALVSPAKDEFSVIVVNGGNSTEGLDLEFVGGLETLAAPGTPLRQFRSTADRFFARQVDVRALANGTLHLSLPPMSVTTVSNRAVGARVGWANYSVPPRTRFPVPFSSDWAAQPIDAPCERMNAVYGAFEVVDVDIDIEVGGTGGAHVSKRASERVSKRVSKRVCQQSVPTNPGTNAWTHRHNGWPSAALPSGANFANYDVRVSARAKVGVEVEVGVAPPAPAAAGSDPLAAVTLCGRQPIFGPSPCQPPDFQLGVCLTIMTAVQASGEVADVWRLTEAHNQYHGGCKKFHTLAKGTMYQSFGDAALKSPGGNDLFLSFSDDTVSASINGKVVASNLSITLSAGVASIGTAWNVAHFADFQLSPHPKHPATANSFMFDVLPSETTVSNFKGWAGFVLDLHEQEMSVKVGHIGRFKSSGNRKAHALAIARGSDGAWVVPPGTAGASVDMASCTTDMLGFCYSAPLAAPIELEAGDEYYIVSSEEAGEAFVNMTKSATGADYGTYRDGDTIMTYGVPTGSKSAPTAAGKALVKGRVSAASVSFGNVLDLKWIVEDGFADLDTSYGPVNVVLA